MSQRKRISTAQEVRSSSPQFSRWSIECNIHAGSYHVFAGKDASKALGLSSTKAEDAVPDWSGLNEEAVKTLDGWFAYFQ
jgi:membrane-associated progesterone receptor component